MYSTLQFERLFIVLTNSYLNDSYTSCSGARAPGLAADMHFRDKVVAFIGPACAFALEPVARLAAYWNRPIITGMGDQVSDTNLDSMQWSYLKIKCSA